MLESIRRKSGSFVVKILLVLLVISFGAWGIGDYVTGQPGGSTAATTGERKISANEFRLAYRQEYARINQSFGGSLTPDMARSFGLPEIVARRMVNDAVVDQAASDAGLLPGDDVVFKTVQDMPQFAGITGDFDRQAFVQAIAGSGFSEAEFIDMVRRQLARASYTGALVSSTVVPSILSERIFRFNEERRDMVVVRIPESAVPVAEVPDEAAITTYFDENADRFQAPDYRRVRYFEIGPENVADEISLSEDEIVTSYEERAGEFSGQSRRDVAQIVFDERAIAEQARTMVDEGQAIEDVALELADLESTDVQLGWLERDDLLPEISDPVFAAGAGDIIGPVESILGWHLLLINDAEDATLVPLDEIRDQIVEGLRRDRALDRVFDLANQADALLGGGSSMEEVATELDLQLVTIDAIDAQGVDIAGAPVAVPGGASFVGNVFSETVGIESTLIEDDDGYYGFIVDEETPSRQRTLEEVREDVIEEITAERQSDNARTVAEELAQRGTSRETLESAATEFGAELVEWQDVHRDGRDIEDLSQYVESLDPVFETAINQPVAVPVSDGYSVVMVTDIHVPDPVAGDEEAEAYEQVIDQIARERQGDFSGLLVRGLTDRFGVEINLGVVEREAF